MCHLGWFQRWSVAIDYNVFLPFIAQLPLGWGRRMALWRGRVNAVLQRDWRKLSFQDKGLDARTRLALASLMPKATSKELEQGRIERYQGQSLEEWEAACIFARDLTELPVRIEGLAPVLELLRQKPRAVLLTSHFGSSILGTTFLHCLGLPVLGMSSNVVDDSRVHPAISRFYRRKYQAMGRYLLGGKILDRQGNAKDFVHFLRKKGVVVIVGDLPPDPHEKPLEKTFLGRPCGFAPGAAKLAVIVDAPLLSFVCESVPQGYLLRFSSPDQDPYDFISEAIERKPSAWWAADLFPALTRSAQI